jgi:putative cardiolipin synthase
MTQTNFSAKALLFLCAFALLAFFMQACGGGSAPVSEEEAQPTNHCTNIKRDSNTSLAAELAPFTDKMKDSTGVYVLEDGGGSMVTRAWLSEYAEETIDIQYFIFSTDNVGLIACDYLVRAADRGVKVRIIVDDIMVDAEFEDILTMDAHENISIQIYNPGMNLGKSAVEKATKLLTDFRSANQRMHNKTFIVDQQVVITGGRNIADEYFDYDHEFNFRDRDVLLLGEVTADVSQSFESFWGSELTVPIADMAGEEAPVYHEGMFDLLHEYACNPANFWPQVRTKIEHMPAAFNQMTSQGKLIWLDSVAFVSDDPGKNDGSEGLSGGGLTTTALVNLVDKAKKSIAIQTPYLITTEYSLEIMRNAVNRGVEIRILTNSLASTDNLEAFSSYQKERAKILATGAKIFEFKPNAAERADIMTGDLHRENGSTPIFGLHAKSMVIDEEITVIGTFNFDPRSANLNTECITIITSEKVAGGVLSGMNKEFEPQNSWEITPDFNPDSEVGVKKRMKTWSRKILPKSIL